MIQKKLIFGRDRKVWSDQKKEKRKIKEHVKLSPVFKGPWLRDEDHASIRKSADKERKTFKGISFKKSVERKKEKREKTTGG